MRTRLPRPIIQSIEATQNYGQDFFLWTQEQAAALRRAKDSNLPLDWENLAEEIEGILRDSPSPRRQIDDLVEAKLKTAAELASSDLSEHGEPADTARAGYNKGGFTAEQVRDDWFLEAADGATHAAHR